MKKIAGVIASASATAVMVATLMAPSAFAATRSGTLRCQSWGVVAAITYQNSWAFGVAKANNRTDSGHKQILHAVSNGRTGSYYLSSPTMEARSRGYCHPL
ncbi:hypothetical protein [Buchananella hordeovulneris]|uniref:hypothetical protein n=1 Tax=Buchananella hordeovulneris TaxID=52770 RepID=UPI0026DC8410|nr:hypothetical protein [Buchananella hordeovulneris]MDO5081200.1 hypothetical protein [Buchananella hordeovulneris]